MTRPPSSILRPPRPVRRRSRSVLPALLVLAGFLASAGPTAALRVGVGADLEIVLPADPDRVERFAARELGRYLHRLAGIDSIVVSEPDIEGSTPRIFVGRTALAAARAPHLAEHPADSFLIRDLGQTLLVAGQNPRGALYGVYALLEDHLGCRWIEPGARGEIVPRLARLDLVGLDELRVPRFPVRTLRVQPGSHKGDSGSGLRPDEVRDYVDWQAKQRLNVLYWHGGRDRESRPFPTAEAFEEVREEVLDRGFVIDQSSHSFRRFGGPGPVDLRSPDAAESMSASIVKLLESYPAIDRVGVWMSDGWDGNVRVQPFELPLDTPPRLIDLTHDARARRPREAVTNSYLELVNRIHRLLRGRDPKPSLSVLAYNRSLLPPTRVACADGMRVYFAPRRSHASALGDPTSARNAAIVDILEGWLEKCPEVILYEYFYANNLGSLNVARPHLIQEDLQFLATLGVQGMASQSHPRYFAALGPAYYAYAKLAWDPTLDLDRVLDDYFAHAYGPGASDARTLLTLLETVGRRRDDHFRYDWKAYFEPYRAKSVLKRIRSSARGVALRTATAEPGVRERGAELASHAEFFATFVRYFAGGRTDEQLRSKLITMAREHRHLACPGPLLECSRQAADG